jgi:hypothetical protein
MIPVGRKSSHLRLTICSSCSRLSPARTMANLVPLHAVLVFEPDEGQMERPENADAEDFSAKDAMMTRPITCFLLQCSATIRTYGRNGAISSY